MSALNDNEKIVRVMRHRARMIADMIIEENTDFRGDLLDEVARCLYDSSQGYTGKIFKIAADKYGMNPSIYSARLKCND